MSNSNTELTEFHKAIELFDIYSDLLTDKQKEYFTLYYFENYTMQEIADNFEVSKSAVSDSVKKTFEILEKYDLAIGMTTLRKHFSRVLKDYKENEIDAENALEQLERVFY